MTAILFFLLALAKYYSHLTSTLFEADQEYLALSGKAILDGHLTLIGAPTSVGNMFIGPFYNYLTAFFLWVFKGNPLVISGLSFFWISLSIPAIYLIGKRLYSKETGFFAALVALLDVEYVNQSGVPPLLYPLPLITLLFIAIAHSRLNKNQKGIWLGILTGISLNLHFTGIFYVPYLLFFGLSWVPPLAILLSPLIYFNIRHQGYIARNALAFLLEQTAKTGNSLTYRLNTFTDSLVSLINPGGINKSFSWIFTASSTILEISSKRRQSIIFYAIVPLVFFMLYSGHLLPYYTIIIWPILFLLLGRALSAIWAKNYVFKIILMILLVIFARFNIESFVSWNPQRSLKYKLAALQYIKQQSGNQLIYVSRTIDYPINFGFGYLIPYVGINDTKTTGYPTYTLVMPYNFEGIKPEVIFGDIGIIEP